jgi:pimeloyl-ACP methyl ester carboxylesterase
VTQRPFFAVREPAGDLRAIALVLHGGRSQGTTAVRAHQLAVVRMTPFTAALRRAGRRHGLAVAHMRYVVRGWNGAERAPVGDVRWVLDQLAERHPGRPVALIGHSMGGRAAVYAAAHPSVRTVVGLAPWLEAGDPYRGVEGRAVLVAHGDHDRITAPAASAAWTRQAATVTQPVGYVRVRDDGHAMLRRATLWHGLATEFVVATLLGDPAHRPARGAAADIVSKVLAGQASLVV